MRVVVDKVNESVDMRPSWINILPPFARERLEGRNMLQKVISNTGWLFADKIIRMGVGLFVGVWIARYLGPEQFGIFNYAIAFVALFLPIANLGLDSIVVREIVRFPSSKDEILGTVFVLKFFSGILIFISVLAAIILVRPEDTLIQCLVGITAGGIIFQAFDTIDIWFESQVASKYTVYIKNISFLIMTIFKIVLIVIKAPLLAYEWAGFAEIAIGPVGKTYVYK